MTHGKLCGLYAITDEDLIPPAVFTERIERALSGGATIIQYRDKSADNSKRHQQASALRELCNRYGSTLIINDDVSLARAVAADGVHLGEDDASIAQARAALGKQAIIGISCYNQLQRALDAQAAGADYVAFGAIFSSATKPAARSASCALITEAKSRLQIPVCAIGGIDRFDAAQAIAAGADMIAVISGLFGVEDVKHTAAYLAGLFD